MSEKTSASPQVGFRRPGGGGNPGEKAKDLGKTLRRLFREVGRFRVLLVGSIFLATVSAIISIFAPNLLSQLTNLIQEGLVGTMPIDAITTTAFTLLGLYALSSLFNFGQGLMMVQVANRFAEKLRNAISQKINRLPLSYFDKNQSGDILSRITNDVDTVSHTLNNSLSSLISNSVLLVGVTLMMFITNWTLALTAVAASVIGFLGMNIIMVKSQKYFIERQQELGRLNGHIEEIYAGMEIIKIYDAEQSVESKFDHYNQAVYDANRKSQFLSGLMQPLMMFIGNFGYVAVCVVGALLTMNGTISFGTIVAFMLYVRMFTNPLSQIAQSTTQMQSAAAAGERVFEFLDARELPTEHPEQLQRLLPKNVRGEIEFDHVNFRYDPKGRMIIQDFSAKALPGQKIAIVGPTGAGKTTLVNLLMKFYNIESGDIRIDGVSISDLTRANVHSLFTMVLQDVWLFAGTVKENIVYANQNATMADVERVCNSIGLDHFVNGLPGGYNAELGENVSISAGQKQLLTIARGMLQDTPFLILDEATSNVDTRTELLVQRAMEKLAEGRTAFIIAHRLSTIRNADLILVMKEGNIIEQGNHEQLMAKNGFYAKLYNAQFETE